MCHTIRHTMCHTMSHTMCHTMSIKYLIFAKYDILNKCEVQGVSTLTSTVCLMGCAHSQKEMKSDEKVKNFIEIKVEGKLEETLKDNKEKEKIENSMLRKPKIKSGKDHAKDAQESSSNSTAKFTASRKTILTFVSCFIAIFTSSFVMFYYHSPKSTQHQTTVSIIPVERITFEWGTTNQQQVNLNCDNNLGFLGDGYCDDEANTEECLYDLGDCCSFGNPDAFTLCSICYCKVNITEMTQNINCWDALHDFLTNTDNAKNGDGICDESFNNINNFFDSGDCCLDESSPECKLSNAFCNPETLGDGKCQDYNNGPKCDYDLGDCCSPNHEEDCCICQCLKAASFNRSELTVQHFQPIG